MIIIVVVSFVKLLILGISNTLLSFAGVNLISLRILISALGLSSKPVNTVYVALI